VQEQACAVLRNLAANDVNQLEIGRQGGIDAIIKALVNDREHAGVQDQGSAALRNLALNAATKEEIEKQGGMEAISKTSGSTASSHGSSE